MDKEKVLIEGKSSGNSVAIGLMATGVGLFIIALIVASNVYNYGKGYESFGFGYGGFYYWCVIYDFHFLKFFSENSLIFHVIMDI